MKNAISKPASRDAVKTIFKLISKAVIYSETPFYVFAEKIGTNGGLHKSMPGRHFSGKVIPSFDIGLEELLEAGFNVTIQHPEFTQLKWNNVDDYKKHLNQTSTANVEVKAD
jgi:hypothetical protein